MLNNRTLIITLSTLFVLILISGQNVKSKSHQSSLTFNEAKVRLEQLQRQLLLVEREARAEIERTVTGQVDTSAKGEFETTKEYEARKTRANELKRQIEESVSRKKEARRDDLNRKINELLVMEFRSSFDAQLGAYDADTERFPLLISSQRLPEILPVPRAEARELKDNFSQAEKRGIFALHLDAQDRAKDDLLTGEISFRGRTYRTESKEMNTQRAMFMLYGNYSSIGNRAKWRAEPPYWEESDEDYQALEAIPTFTKVFLENNTNKFILITGSVAEGEKEFGGCHGCGVKMGIAILSQKVNTWRIEAGQKDVGLYGSWGMPPDAALIKLGKDRYAVKLSGGDMGQGIVVEGVKFIDRVGGVFKEILSIQTSEDTSGAGLLTTPESNVSYTSKIEYIPGNHPIYFDIKVIASGKRGVKVGRRIVMRPFSEVKIYKFSNGMYKLTG